MRCLILDDDVMFSLELKKRIDNFLSKIFSDYTIDIINNAQFKKIVALGNLIQRIYHNDIRNMLL